jgi:ATP-binding cassette subfamily B protein
MHSLRRRAFTLASAPYRVSRSRFVLATVASFASVAVPLVGAVSAGRLINSVVAGHSERATAYALVVGLAVALQYVIIRFQSFNFMWVADAITNYFEHEMIALSVRIPGVAHLETPEYLDKLELMRYQPRQLASAAMFMVGGVITLTTFIVGIGFVLTSVSPVLLVLPPVAAVSLWVTSHFRTRVHAAFDATAESRRVANQFFGLATTPGRAEEIRTLRIGDELIARHDEAWSRADQMMKRVEIRNFWINAGAGLLTNIAYFGAVAFVAERAIHGHVPPGDIVLTVILAGVINQQLSTFIDGFAIIGRGLFQVDTYLWLVDYADENSHSEGVLVPPDRISDGIRLEQVSFRYSETHHDVLDRVDLHLPAGTIVAVVGDNGAGKTTLVKLLTGMYTPTAGVITVDGAPLDEIDVAAWRTKCSAAFQDFARFELTAQHAIGIGDLPKVDDRAGVIDALAHSGASDLPDALDHGLDTALGASLEGGVQLSGGQWQKIALARSMMRSAPLLLVFDEPTASLDPDAERALFVRWAARARATAAQHGAITLMVSHRFSTVRMADLIVVLDERGVREIGTHDELIAQHGMYAELYALQASSYIN